MRAQFEIVSTVQKEGYQQIRFEFYSEIGERVPCYLLIPDGDKEKYPVAITQQGHSFGFHISIGEFQNEQEKVQYGHEDFAVQAVRCGFIALAIENRGMGERMATRVSRESSVICRFASVTALSKDEEKQLIDFDLVKRTNKSTIRDALKRVFPERHIHEFRYTFITRAKNVESIPKS